MKRNLLATIVILLVSTSMWAGSTYFYNTWKNPTVEALDTAGKKLAVFVMSPDDSMRLGPEETLASEMRSRGVDCVAGYTVLPGELAKEPEKAKEFLNKVGITDVIMIRPVSKDEEVHFVAGSVWYTQPHYPSFWGYWGYGWSAVYSPGYVYSKTVVSLETLLYSIEGDTLLWAGASRTDDPKDIRKFVKDLVKKAGVAMRKDGLLMK